MMRAMSMVLALGLFVGCTPPEPPPKQEPSKAKTVDLNALAAARAGSSGAQLEEQLAEARSLNATQAYANREGEPTLADLEAKGEAPAVGSAGFDPLAGANAGSAAPSDLDTLDDTGGPQAWINMQAVEQRILAKTKSLNACWENAGRSGSGRMEFAMTIAPGGKASRVSLAKGSPERDPAVADCAARALRNTRYPEPRGGSVSFVYPVKF